ncbi:hypothetical protein AVEN_151886-1 [Araneus ventricosus]|uniref:Uncharacterized protein n=1 Tax=Araneus ventricosus TaxID=182803 RepID=A0A4Y2CVR5_ARAVE|nr:hypothetical protein AVEN_68195-1 [Araneus ventricosus]GBM08578.1 hypothetical protein AVEN_75477-1 [Araneus ventricosus]GBM08583.1 hypothetical protein AVEN_75705-1 [Araneus ventricosus]GBM08601.1 hypothetical protein AVEN_151886-1 [Araneus ventricosus]
MHAKEVTYDKEAGLQNHILKSHRFVNCRALIREQMPFSRDQLFYLVVSFVGLRAFKFLVTFLLGQPNHSSSAKSTQFCYDNLPVIPSHYLSSMRRLIAAGSLLLTCTLVDQFWNNAG